MEEPLFMFQLIIAVDVSEHRSIYNKLNAPCSGDFNITKHIYKQFYSRETRSTSSILRSNMLLELKPILPG